MRDTKREQMGAVHVRVRLTNATDIGMVERGLLESNQVRSCEVDALVDTGASKSVIPPNVAQRLGLTTWRGSMAVLADGRRLPVGISGPISFEIEGRQTVEDAYVLGDEVLIGQTVLESTDLLVDCTRQKVIPNPAHPEGPMLRI